MGDGVNVAARLEGVCEPGAIYLSSAAYEQVRDRLKETFVDLGETTLKNIAGRCGSMRCGSASAPRRKPGRYVHELRGTPRLSIVVLPFANIGGDPEQDYFVDGVTESLTTDLSRIRGTFVIARNTAFTYKGKPWTSGIGRELNVRYALEGSVQRGGEDARQRPADRRRKRRSPLGRALRQAARRPVRHAGRDRRPSRRSSTPR